MKAVIKDQSELNYMWRKGASGEEWVESSFLIRVHSASFRNPIVKRLNTHFNPCHAASQGYGHILRAKCITYSSLWKRSVHSAKLSMH